MIKIVKKLRKIAIGSKSWKNSPRMKPVSKPVPSQDNVINRIILLQYESLKLKERLEKIEKEIVDLGGSIVTEKHKNLEQDFLNKLNK